MTAEQSATTGDEGAERAAAAGIAAAERDARRRPDDVRPTRLGWVREAAIVLGFYYVYQTVRSLAAHGNTEPRATHNANWIITWEKHLWMYHEQRIQDFFLGAEWFIRAMNIYYGTLHFVITAGLLIWMYVRRHSFYPAMRNLLGLTTALAIIGYWSFPLAPPRLHLNCNGDIPVLAPGGLVKPACFVDTLAEIGGLWSYESPAAKAVANQFAAMPSLHFGWSVWCGIVFWRFAAHRTTRAMAVVYPALTLFAIVVTANHWILDAAGGAIIIIAATLILRVAAARRERGRVSAEPDGAPNSTDPGLEPTPSAD